MFGCRSRFFQITKEIEGSLRRTLVGLQLVFNKNSKVLDIGLSKDQAITEKAQQYHEALLKTLALSLMLYVVSLSSCRYIETNWLASFNPNPNPGSSLRSMHIFHSNFRQVNLQRLLHKLGNTRTSRSCTEKSSPSVTRTFGTSRLNTINTTASMGKIFCRWRLAGASAQ